VIWRALADLTLVTHLAFILFVGLGGLLVVRWPRLAWLHLPVATWGAAITFGGWVCPLTPLENHFRRLGGRTQYTEGFIEHYLVPLIYPRGIPEGGWLALGVGVIVVNAVFYGWVVLRGRRSDPGSGR
jgi:hypothetical protein